MRTDARTRPAPPPLRPSPRPGPPALVVASAALELGRAHWGAALVALPLARRACSSPRASRTRGSSARRRRARAHAPRDRDGRPRRLGGRRGWAMAVHVAAAGACPRRVARHARRVVPGRAAAVRPLARLRDADEAADHVAAPRDGRRRDVRRRGRLAAARSSSRRCSLGLALACGGASALNHVIDRDIDRLMGSRTAARPVASGRVPAPRALEFGLVLSALSFVAPRLDGERAHGRSSRSSATSSTSSCTPAT